MDARSKLERSKVRPYADVDHDDALYERAVAMHARGKNTAAEELWRKAKRSPRELANP
jgi:hypothetical protein